MTIPRLGLKDAELLYAATARCRCGAGLAYPLDSALSRNIGAWVCSAVLKGDVPDGTQAQDQSLAGFTHGPPVGEHDALPWAFYKVREETSVNNRGGHSTRPPGTIARSQGRAKCPKCLTEWSSQPYDATCASHWHSGPCPNCGYAVGGNGSYSSRDGVPIETRFKDVVLVATAGSIEVVEPEPSQPVAPQGIFFKCTSCNAEQALLTPQHGPEQAEVLRRSIVSTVSQCCKASVESRLIGYPDPSKLS